MKKKYIVIALIVVVCLSIPTFFVLKYYLSDRETINRRFGVELPDSFSIVEYYKHSNTITAAKIKCGNEEDVEEFMGNLSEYESISGKWLKDEITGSVEGKMVWWDVNKDHLKPANKSQALNQRKFLANNRRGD